MTAETRFRAVLWDFGGVISASPFEAFNDYEAANGLPKDLIRSINATNPDDNAWARFERSEIDRASFCQAFAREAKARGYTVDGEEVLGLIEGAIRPEMVAALETVAKRYRTACLTNNVKNAGRSPARRQEIDAVYRLFDMVIESSRVGVRKPDPAFYEIACDKLGISPEDAVYLDDLGINLKPARALGMHTIKVVTPDQALGELETALGHPVR